jgi:C-terminal processing protease CtpA/Prc
MKKLVALFSILATLMIVVSSCETKDPIVEKGTLQSATYNPATKSFTLTYSSGQTETVNAVVDDKTDPPTATATLKDGTVIYAGDATVAGAATIAKEINIVSQFVYDGMSLYYFWADEVKNKKPTVADVNPENYFYKILNSTDTQHGWSWITDDVNALLADFSGKSLSFGYNIGFIIINNVVYAYVKYVYDNTPAAKAGLKRLDLIGKLNGQFISTEQRGAYTYVSDKDMNLLYGNSTVSFSIYKFLDNNIILDKEVSITPDESDKDPVLYENIYTVGDKKVGYLFYTNFYDNFNYRLFEAFNKFKQAGITDLILDLRYNTGGSVSSAIYLSSLIAPRTAVENKSPFIVMDYNNLLNTSFDKWYDEAAPADKYKYDRKDYLGTYSSNDKNPLDANLNLDKVYIIATGNSYSASELVTHCLKSYMNVVHIGSNTGGKYTASWTIHAYDKELGATVYDTNDLKTDEKTKLKKWAMQPIVAMYANKDSKSFNIPGYLSPDYNLEEGFGYIDRWTQLGDTKDVFLGQALYLISGNVSYLPVEPSSTRSIQTIRKEIVNRHDEAKPVIIDNIKLTADDFQKLILLRK